MRLLIPGYLLLVTVISKKKLFEPGETISAGLPVLTMIGKATSEVEINIPSSEYIQRDQFDSYHCSVDIFPGKSFPLQLIGITHKANMNQLYTMRFRLSGEEKNLPGPGMSTMVTILYKPEEGRRVSVPLSSVFETNQGSSVWVYDGVTETVRSHPVKIAQVLVSGIVVISSGLEEGDVVISAGVHSLKEGEKVRLLPAVSPTNVGGML
ncbi:MAG: HlyD family efflux transporter periplasmic adaptor subunit [Bacteroides sp.]|nr:HlyD family efflux transporter periplasmic adaptor subunit [Bacteroides sp.]